MRTALLLLVLAGLALASPGAQAQAPFLSQYNVTLAIVPPTEALMEDAPLLVVDGVIQFVGDATYLLAIGGIPVEYEVTQAPAWLTVVASPSNDVLQPGQPGANGQVTTAKSFSLSLHLAEKVESSRVDVVEITATVRPASPGAASRSVSATVPVAVHVPEEEGEPCPDHFAAKAVFGPAPAAQEPAAAPEEEPLVVQSGGAVVPASTWGAIGAFGLAGAGAGFAIWRRRSA